MVGEKPGPMGDRAPLESILLYAGLHFEFGQILHYQEVVEALVISLLSSSVFRTS